MFLKLIRNIIIGTMLFAFVPMIFSCSDSVPEISKVSYYIVFDFEEDDKNPEVSLAVFLQLNSEARRASKMIVSKDSSDYSWIVENPEIFSSDDKNYVFAKNLRSDAMSTNLAGSYTVSYADLTDNETEGKFVVAYDKRLVESTPKNALSFAKGAQKNIAVYNEKNEVIYFGKPKDSWNTPQKILENYNKAVSKRDVYFSAGSGVYILLPKENL